MVLVCAKFCCDQTGVGKAPEHSINSLAPARFESNFSLIIFKLGLFRVSSKSQPQNSSTFQDLFKAFLLNSRPLSTQILCILRKYFYIRDCKIWSVELFHIVIHDYDIILSPKRHSDIERGLRLVNNGSSSGWLLDETTPLPEVQWWHMKNPLVMHC